MNWQDTLHTDSGLDTEEIVPASPPHPPEPRSCSGQLDHPLKQVLWHALALFPGPGNK